MLEPTLIIERKFNKETERLIGQSQLQNYGNFLESYQMKLNSFKKKLANDKNIKIQPVGIEREPSEDIKLLQLIHSDNKLLTRIFLSLASLCHEIDLLVEEADEFYHILASYEDDQRNNLEKFAALLEVLQKLIVYIDRSQIVISLLLRQLSGLLGKGFYSGTSFSCFPGPLDCLGHLLVCLITFDSLLSRQCVKNHCNLFRSSIRHMLSTPMHYEISEENLQCLFRKVVEIEENLLSGNILQNVFDKCLEETLLKTIKECSLSHEFTLYLQQMLNDLEKDEENISFTQTWLQANALLVFQQKLFGSCDKKTLKRLLDVNKKISACTIYGNILWYPEKFILKYVSLLEKIIDVKACSTIRINQIAAKSQNLTKDVNLLSLQVCQWLIEINKAANQNMSKLQIHQLNDACDLLIDGLKMLTKMSVLLKWLTNLHADIGRPMAKSMVTTLCKLMEIMKCVEYIFSTNLLPLTYIILLITQHLSHKSLVILSNVKKGMKHDKAYKDQHLDVLSALIVAEHAITGPPTKKRLLLAKLALSASGLPYDMLADIRSVIHRIELITNLKYLLDRLCNCSFLYWHQVLLPVYLTKLVESHSNFSNYYLLLRVLDDSSAIDARFSVNMKKLIEDKLTFPLSQQVENNLRFQTHLHLQLPLLNPLQNPPPHSFKKMFPGILHNNYINVKKDVEHSLSATFYNLTTVAQHDWKTYVEMRRLALLQYGLDTVESNLPMHTLEQGLDVLEIMRNINVFVSKYLYNLNNQVFVEEWSNNKHLNTIHISHIANSIRTHGIGIMNTTVNFTYQFLQNKFFTFSQFMFDELIKSRLLKDIRFFSDHKSELKQMYPYDRAEKFNIGIRKLGLNQDGLSYLDLFRKLITQIGNAMGYVRLIRSGGRRCLADATCFIPDLQSVDKFNEAIENTNFLKMAKNASASVTRELKNLSENFEEATEYFKLLISVFSSVFRNPQNIHLRNFYAIIPALTINFIEHSLACKERLNKKNRDGAAFTDDGFAMGLAYIIELLDQSCQLNTLHWFESVRAKISNDRRNLKQQWDKASKDDQKLQQALSLTEKRVNSYDAEFQLFFYNLSSARIFFQ